MPRRNNSRNRGVYVSDGGVGFTPRNPGFTSRLEIAYLIVAALTSYGCWRILEWFAGKNPASIPWRVLRYGWPTSMVAWAWLILLTEASEILFGIWLVFNLPVYVVVIALAPWVSGLEGWPRGLFMTVVAWITWYGIMRFLEWRADSKQPVILRIVNRLAKVGQWTGSRTPKSGSRSPR